MIFCYSRPNRLAQSEKNELNISSKHKENHTETSWLYTENQGKEIILQAAREKSDPSYLQQQQCNQWLNSSSETVVARRHWNGIFSAKVKKNKTRIYYPIKNILESEGEINTFSDK